MKLLFTFLAMFFISQTLLAQADRNWTDAQLMAPADLAKKLETNKKLPVIISVGPGAVIPHSIDIGMTKEDANMVALKKQLSGLPKTTEVVLYCGCCPFEHCPNVRPAIRLLNEMHFSNFHLLNIPSNIRKDWIDKGYPVEQ